MDIVVKEDFEHIYFLKKYFFPNTFLLMSFSSRFGYLLHVVLTVLTAGPIQSAWLNNISRLVESYRRAKSSRFGTPSVYNIFYNWKIVARSRKTQIIEVFHRVIFVTSVTTVGLLFTSFARTYMIIIP